MMEFTDNKPIYRQIVDHAFSQILDGRWEAGSRIPSVRELAASLGVNTRTVMKAMEDLQGEGVIYARRGMGYTLAEDAPVKIRDRMRNEFFDETIKGLKIEMSALGITVEELVEALGDRK